MKATITIVEIIMNRFVNFSVVTKLSYFKMLHNVSVYATTCVYILKLVGFTQLIAGICGLCE